MLTQRAHPTMGNKYHKYTLSVDDVKFTSPYYIEGEQFFDLVNWQQTIIQALDSQAHWYKLMYGVGNNGGGLYAVMPVHEIPSNTPISKLPRHLLATKCTSSYDFNHVGLNKQYFTRHIRRLIDVEQRTVPRVYSETQYSSEPDELT